MNDQLLLKKIQQKLKYVALTEVIAIVGLLSFSGGNNFDGIITGLFLEFVFIAAFFVGLFFGAAWLIVYLRIKKNTPKTEGKVVSTAKKKPSTRTLMDKSIDLKRITVTLGIIIGSVVVIGILFLIILSLRDFF